MLHSYMEKSNMRHLKVLKLYEQDAETEVHTDASKDDYGAVMLQRYQKVGELHPVQYMSKKTDETIYGEAVNELNNERKKIRNEAAGNIEKIQKENKDAYDDLVAIKRMQTAQGKLTTNYLGPYEITQTTSVERG